MRTGTLVLVAYVLCVLLASVWRLMPASLLRDAIPDIGALTAAYLGLTARRDLAPAICGSVVLGYLVDVISGQPAGLASLVLGLTCLVTRTVQQRLLVRGTMLAVAFSAFVAIVAGFVGIIVRALFSVPHAAMWLELKHIALATIATAIIGPLVWRVFRRIDAAFARTHRERDAALEGLQP